MVNIDRESCIHCGLCTKVCAGLVLSMDEQNFPKYAPKGCINCGHCESACPNGAIWLDDDLFTAAPDNELEQLLLSRRSIRHFHPEAPARELISSVLQKAQWAPSSKNQRLNGWSVIYGKEQTDSLLEKAMEHCRTAGTNRGLIRLYDCGINLITCGAPCIIFSWISEQAINHELDCAIAAAQAELMLTAQGLGTCWGGFATRLFSGDSELRAMAGIPQDARLCCTLMTGFPAEHYHSTPGRPSARIIWKESNHGTD